MRIDLLNKIPKVYFAYILVMAVSVIATLKWPVSETIQNIAALPGVGALFLVLFQIWKDRLSHDRAIELQSKQQDFVLGTASHMAEVAYDKHVLFCEAYIARVQKGFQELLRDGPSKNCLNIGRELVNIRQDFSPWLTKEIETKLKPFEQILIKIGAKDGLIENLPIGEQRNKVIDEVYKSFGLILGHEQPGSEEEEGLAIDQIIEKIRVILGINILTELRTKTAELALVRVRSSK